MSVAIYWYLWTVMADATIQRTTPSWFWRQTLLEELFTFVLAVPPFLLFLFQSFTFPRANLSLFWLLITGGGTAAMLFGWSIRLLVTRRIRRLSRGTPPTTTEEASELKRELFNYPVWDAAVMLIRWIVLVNALVVIPYGSLGMLDPGAALFTLIISTLNGAVSALIFYFVSIRMTLPLRAHTVVQAAPEPTRWMHRDRIRVKTLLTVVVTAAYPAGILGILIYLTAVPEVTLMITVLEMITLTVSTVAFIVLAASGLNSNIKFSIHQVRDSLEELKQGGGDLTYRAPVVSADTSGLLAASFNEFLANFSTLVAQVKRSAHELEQSGLSLHEDLAGARIESETVGANTESVVQRIREQDSRLAQSAMAVGEIIQTLDALSRLIEEQSSAVTESSASVTEMVASVQSVTGNVHHLGTSMEQLSEATRTGAERMESMNTQVTEISRQGETLQEANRLIQAIAAQTNLLAMNAAIEAAHAGDAGRGFSVVADEIRNLAESASVQSKQIARQLKEIDAIIGTVVESSEDVRSGFRNVESLLSDVQQIEQQVRSSMDEQSAGSQETLKALTHITEVTERISRDAVSITERAQQVGEDVNSVVAGNSEISSELVTMIEAVGRIGTMMTGLAERETENRRAIERMRAGVEQFKTREV